MPLAACAITLSTSAAYAEPADVVTVTPTVGSLPSKTFTVVHNSDGTVSFKEQSTGTCAELSVTAYINNPDGDPIPAETEIKSAPCTGSPAQKFTFEKSVDNSVRIRNVSFNQCLTSDSAEPRIGGFPCDVNRKNQRWIVRDVASQ
ncbi:RICIN domain-containing protein [Streptomyces sioyaensis]